MTGGTFGRLTALAAATGMRSFAGPAVMAAQHGGPLGTVVPMMAAVELIADKTPFIGSRLDRGPLAGRVVMGALVGGLLARREDASAGLGALLGAAAAFAAAHAAYHLRARMKTNNILSGLAEDCVVAGLCAGASAGARQKPYLRSAR